MEPTGVAPAAGMPKAPAEVPESWPAWLRALQAPERWSAAVSVAERGAREWSYDDFVRDPTAVSDAADLVLGDRPDWGNSALRDALPHILEFVLSNGVDARLRALYDNVFLVMVLDEQQSLAQLRAFLRVIQARLELGLNEHAYRELVQELATAFDRVNTPSCIDVALDALDALTSAACPAVEARQMFAAAVGALTQRWYRRVDHGHRLLLKALSEELGVPFALAEEQTEESAADVPWAFLDNKTVALYSLQESALRRAATILGGLCAGVHVVCFHDKVGGAPALRAAATSADVFVIATAVAKHAATGFIEMNRRQRPTLYARGGGSASILSAIKEHIADHA